VAYRETIRHQVESEGKYIKQTAAAANTAIAGSRLKPMEPAKA